MTRCRNQVSTGRTRDPWLKWDTALDPLGHTPLVRRCHIKGWDLMLLFVPVISIKHWYEEQCIWAPHCWQQPAAPARAAHLHAWDTWGAILAIDAWETLQKREESLGLTPREGLKGWSQGQ